MTQIIGLAGKKQSGKNTIANFLHGHVLKLNEVLRNFVITKNGDLKVNTHFIVDGEVKEDAGVLDLTQQNELFLKYADANIWPYIKLYHFADPLKEICSGAFGLTYEQVYGSAKNTVTKLKWQDMPGVMTPEAWESLNPDEPDGDKNPADYGITIHEAGMMKAREVLQFVGTEIFRKMRNSIWADILVNRIKADSPLIAVVADCRFDNEAEAIKKAGGLLIRLSRAVEDDKHSSEDGFKDTVFDLEVDNQSMSIEESCQFVLDFLVKQGIKEFMVKAEE